MVEVVLLATTNAAAPGRAEQLRRLLVSIRPGPALPVRMLLLVQNAAAADRLPPLPDWVTPLYRPEILSVSKARNVLLRETRRRHLAAPDDLVSFPDDDCWYTPGFLPALAGLFARTPSLGFWMCRYGSNPEAAAAMDRGRAARYRDVVRNASANNTFFRGRVLDGIGEYDERLGNGAPYPGGEDTDMALRAFRRAAHSLFVDAALVGHRDKAWGHRVRYFPGDALALGLHALSSPAAAAEFTRKLAVGGYLVLKGDMPTAGFLRCAGMVCRAALRPYPVQPEPNRPAVGAR